MALPDPSSLLPSRLPRATYRMQLHRDFGIAEVASLLSYLDSLGISDCYLSPMFQAAPGSTHGYDTHDYSALNSELGSEEAHRRLATSLRERGMGLLADFVPNHMGAAVGNAWWRDVLENGRCSPYAAFFDIDWHPVKAELRDKILLPILGDQYGVVLERGELRLRLIEPAQLVLSYFDTDLPLNPRQYATVLEQCRETLRDELTEADDGFQEYLSVITAFRNLPTYTESAPERIAERQREKEVARRRLGDLLATAPRIRARLEEALGELNGVAGRPETFDRLHALLEQQPYRLSYWRTASHEINYRRFFDINELAGLRMEQPEVFEATHALLLELIAEDRITGLRLDHVDGLFDPLAYLATLQKAIRERRAAGGETPSSFYIVVEKILSEGESLRSDWPVAGSTGYDFLAHLNGLFVDSRRQRELLRVYRRFTGRRESYADVLYASKQLIMDGPMASELNVLAHALNRLSELDRRSRDFTLNSLRQALREVVACFPIYRTYVDGTGAQASDREVIDLAVRRARRRNPTFDPSLFAFVRDALLPESAAARRGERAARLEFAMRFQQYTGPVEAKGREDTSFYRYCPLLSQNEVGGDPGRFGVSPAAFHAANEARAQHWPHGLLATSTHDTKRSEDVRARLNVISEVPGEWSRLLSRWSRINTAHRERGGDEPAPDRNDEYAFYQSLLGLWPCGAENASDELVQRLLAAATKAAREAKLHTSWLHPDDWYETALAKFVKGVLTGPSAPRFLASFLPFQRRLAALGMVGSLAQVVLKAVSPGVPDFYQGSELWDLCLVDPDNRRPVDYPTRRDALSEMEALFAAGAAAGGERARALGSLLDHWEDGRIKLFVTATLLRLRRRLSELFAGGHYLPLALEGTLAEHAVALARCNDGDAVIAVVPRLLAGLVDDVASWRSVEWANTGVVLPPPLRDRAYEEVFSGRRIAPAAAENGGVVKLATLFADAPIAVLVGGGATA